MKRSGKIVIYIAVIVAFGLYFAYKSGFFSDVKYSSSPKKKFVMNESVWNEMTTKMHETALRYPGKVAILIKDFNTSREWDFNGDKKFPSASLVKVPVMVSVFALAEKEKLDLNSELILRNRDRRSGSGTLKWAREGTRISILETIYKMITESDNTATQMLIDNFGMYFFQKEFQMLGLKVTNICQDGLSLSSFPVKNENYTTAREIAFIFEEIYKKEMVSQNASLSMLEILKGNKSRSRLRSGTPREWSIGHKTGLLRKACHDVGIVFSPNGDYLLAVLTLNGPNYKSAKRFISQIAKIVSAYYQIESSMEEK